MTDVTNPVSPQFMNVTDVTHPAAPTCLQFPVSCAVWRAGTVGTQHWGYHSFALLTFCVEKPPCAWWRHQVGIFSAFLALCEGNPPVIGGFPSQGPVTRSFDIFFDLCLNKRLSKQQRRWWFETPSRSLWRHCNGFRLLVPIFSGSSVVCCIEAARMQHWRYQCFVLLTPCACPVDSQHSGSVMRTGHL